MECLILVSSFLSPISFQVKSKGSGLCVVTSRHIWSLPIQAFSLCIIIVPYSPHTVFKFNNFASFAKHDEFNGSSEKNVFYGNATEPGDGHRQQQE